MHRSAQRILQSVVVATVGYSLAVAQGPIKNVSSVDRNEEASIRAKISSLTLGDWAYNGFKAIDASTQQDTPWFPFISSTKGFVAMFKNPLKDIQNTGKGGGSQGFRHPEFDIWIFPKTATNTPERFEDTITAHQMVQSSIPTILGSSKNYILACVGDCYLGEKSIKNISTAFKISQNVKH